MATFVAALATKIVKPSSAQTKIALLDLTYTGANRSGLTLVPLLETAEAYDVASIPAGITFILDKDLSVHDSNYASGTGLRVWMSVDLIQFRSMTSSSSVVFKVWQYDTVASSATVLQNNSNVDVTFTLQDIVEVVSVKDNQTQTITASSNVYTVQYYPSKDTKVPTTNKIKVAEIVITGGRVHTDPLYDVYVYEDDADSAVFPEGASYTLVSNSSNNTSTLSLFYDVGLTPVETRDLSIYKDIALTITDKYRSLNVTVRIVPIANPATSILYATETLTYNDYPVYSLTSTEITSSFTLGTVSVTSPLSEKTYSLTSLDAGYTASGLTFKPAAPITPSRDTRKTVDAATMFTISENGRTFALSDNTIEFYLVEDISITSSEFGLNGVYTDNNVEVTETNVGTGIFSFKIGANKGLGDITASITFSSIAGSLFDATDYSVRDTTVALSCANLSATIESSSTIEFSFGEPALSRALNIPAANTSTYARFLWDTLTIVNGTKTYTVNPKPAYNVNKALLAYTPLYTIPNALHAYSSALSTSATKIYVNRALTNGQVIFPRSQMVRGGYKASPTFQVSYGTPVGVARSGTSTALSTTVVASGTTRENGDVDFEINDTTRIVAMTYSFVWFETFAPSLPTDTIVVFQADSGTNASGRVYREGFGDTKVFNINGGDNAPLVANASDATVVTLERVLKTGGSWSTWEDAVVLFTLSTVNSAVTGYATIILSGADVNFDSALYSYRIKYDVASKAFDEDQLYSHDHVLVSSNGKNNANVVLYQSLVIEDISYSLVTDVATDSAKYPLNFNPFGTDSATYIDLSPSVDNTGLLNIAKSGTYKLPAYQVIAHNTSTDGLIRIKSSGVQITAAGENDCFAFGIVNTTPVGEEVYGIGSTLPSDVTYTNIAAKATTVTNAPVLYAGEHNLGTYVQVNGSLKITACGNSALNLNALNLHVSDITAIATPLRPDATNTYALVCLHAISSVTITTLSTAYTRFGVLNSDLVTSVSVKLYDNKAIQFPDCFRMQLDGITYNANGVGEEEQLLTYRIMARSIGQTATYVETVDEDFNPLYIWTVTGTPSNWFQLASNASGAGVTEAELNVILATAGRSFQKAVTGDNAGELPALAAQPEARRNPGWPERWVTYQDSIPLKPYGKLNPDGESYDVSRWLEYRIDVQNKAAFADVAGDAGYGYISSNIIRPADGAEFGDFKRRSPLEVNYRTTDTVTSSAVSSVYPAIYRKGALDNGELLTVASLGLYIGPVVGTHILVPSNPIPQYLLAFDPRNT